MFYLDVILSRYRPTYSRSFHDTFTPDKAVDGNYDGVMYDGRTNSNK